MLIFGLHSTFDDRPSDPSKKRRPKCKKNKKGPLPFHLFIHKWFISLREGKESNKEW